MAASPNAGIVSPPWGQGYPLDYGYNGREGQDSNDVALGAQPRSDEPVWQAAGYDLRLLSESLSDCVLRHHKGCSRYVGSPVHDGRTVEEWLALLGEVPESSEDFPKPARRLLFKRDLVQGQHEPRQDA